MKRLFGGTLCLLGALVGACGGSSNGGDGVAFHGQQQALPGYSYDTGYQPATPPVQVRLVLASAGTLVADARATGSGDEMTPTAGSGKYTLDAHLTLQALVKIDVAGVGQLEGAIPGAPDIDLAFGGETAFEPFLLGATASVTADVPETQIAEIPLGTIPGTLVIKALGTVGSEFSGECARAQAGVGQYTGTTTTGGTVTLRPSVVLEVPLVGSRTYDIPEIQVAIPPAAAPLDLGARSLADGAVVTGTGPCGEVATDGGVAPQDGGGSCRLSCPGCCAGATCQAGTEASACGVQGQECAACHGSTPYCMDGICSPGAACADTCSGCCDGETCNGGTGTAACGSGGAACRACTGTDQCVAGQCRGTGTCASTCAGCCTGESCFGGTAATACGTGGASCVACPSHFVCGLGKACELDAASLWDVYAVDAELPPLDPEGATWDSFGGAPDGFVVINTYVSGAVHLSGESTTKDDVFKPVWNELLLAGVSAGEILSGGLGFTLYDYDPTTFNDLIGSCSGLVPATDFDGQPHAACGGLLKVRYTIMPH